MNQLKTQDISFPQIQPADNLYFLFFCPETYEIPGRSDIRFNLTFFNTSRKSSMSRNVTELWNKELNQWEEYSLRSIPPKSSIEFVFSELSKRTILGLDPENWSRFKTNITYLDTYDEEGIKEYPISHNMSLFNLKILRVELLNLSNEHRKFGMYLKTYEPMTGSVRPGVLFLIVTFVLVVVLFIIVAFIILRSGRIIRLRYIEQSSG